MNWHSSYIFVIFGVVVLVTSIIVYWYQNRLLKRVNQLMKQSEESKKQIIAEQKRNQQLKQEMTNNISHELKTPVSSIRGYLEILLSDKPLDEAKRRYFLERCYQQTLRLSDLIHDVSLINKLEEAYDLFPKEQLNLYDILQEAIHDLEDNAALHKDLIENNLTETMQMYGNRNLLYYIFRNLIENSILYAGDEVTIAIRCYKETDDAYYLHFYDDGCGVGNQYLDKLFDRFLRIDEGRSRKTGGTGLGLSIVKHAVQFHGGSIYAKNREQGGLEFFFSLRK